MEENIWTSEIGYNSKSMMRLVECAERKQDTRIAYKMCDTELEWTWPQM